MTDVHRNARIAVRTVLAIVLAPALAGPARAGEGKWTLQIEPMAMDAYGHDQQVLTIHEIDLGSTPQVDAKSAVTLDTDNGPAYRAELQRTGPKWGWGVDFFWFNTSQGRPSRTAAAGGAADQVVFEVADRRFTSNGPGEILYFNVLEDTDLVAWTADLYAKLTLAGTAQSGIHLQFGLRVADFDNDYRAVVGVEGVGGSQLDASSNYGLMLGPIVGLAGDFRHGKSSIKGYLGQSVVVGTAELSTMSREFAGPFGAEPAFFARESLAKDQDVAVPISELRIKWTYSFTDRLAFGLGVNASAWWDVPVPPGVVPVPGGDQVLHEDTIVFLGTLAALELSF